MKITARPLKGDHFDIEAEPDDTVEQLKKKIAASHPEFPAEHQKLIYCGKILTDAMLVKDQNIKEGDFLVVMATKPKAPAAGEAGTGSSPAPAPAAAPAAAAPAPAPMDTDAPVSMEAAQAQVVTGSAMEGTIQQLCDMGFTRPEVERCLQAAFNNPDRAVEYLMTGIPDNAMTDATPQAPPAGEGTTPATPASQAPPAAKAPPPVPPAAVAGGGGGAAPFPSLSGSGGGGGGAGGGAGADVAGMFAELRNNPNFAQLAQVVSQNPAMLAQLLPALAQSSPQLAQAIQQNPQAFMQMLQSTVAEGGVNEQDPVAVMLAAAQAGGPAPGQPGGPTVVRLSPEEMAAVERLQGLGFSREACVQAYLACDKNEEIAANFLFESMDES